jgi:hypothetical protein
VPSSDTIKDMIDVESLVSQVKRNCNISDARHWGYYSLCGLLLRLRELYRAEKGIALWERLPQEDVGQWISEREHLWRELEEEELKPITINGNLFGPFEVEKINARLQAYGLIYGAGVGVHKKPCFFLANLLSTEIINGLKVSVAGNEYARDLSDHPAMLQGNVIYARVALTKLLIWTRFEEMRCRGKSALSFAFSHYGIQPGEPPSEDVEQRVSLIARAEAETYIHHEIGEAVEGEKIGGEWKAFLASLPQGRVELFARAAKDILADTGETGMLNYIIRGRKAGSLGFYIVFLSGMRKLLFPEMQDAFSLFAGSGDWSLIDRARKAGYRKASGYVEKLLLIHKHNRGEEAVTDVIEREMLGSLL